jgi:glutamate synthase (NADPH/NADH) large chain
MLYDKSLEKDNCGFGLIAHIEGEPSHKVVRTAIHALARMQHRGAILADGKTGDGCGLLLQKPDRFFRIVAEERGWRLAKNYAVGMLFLNQDPEKAAASRRIVEEELQRETLSLSAGAMCQPTKGCSVKSPSPRCLVLNRFLLTRLRAGVHVIWNAVCLSPVAALKSVSRKIKSSTSVASLTW